MSALAATRIADLCALLERAGPLTIAQMHEARPFGRSLALKQTYAWLRRCERLGYARACGIGQKIAHKPRARGKIAGIHPTLYERTPLLLGVEP